LGRGGAGIEWAWDGYLSPGHITLLVGLWKCGKSTLLAHLLKMFGTGGDLGGEVHKARVLLLTEESPAIWADRRDEIGIGANVDVICRPFFRRPDANEWHDFMGEMVSHVQEYGYRVVVLDPLPTMWPVTRENDASEVGDAMLALQGVAHAGAALLLLHHPTKGDATEGRASRGSGALTGFVDVILEFRRFDAERREDRRRVLTSYSRFPETPAELVVNLTDRGYVAEGSRSDAKRDDRLTVAIDVLQQTDGAMTIEGILNHWPTGDSIPKPGLRTLRNDLQHAFDGGRVSRVGDGCKGRPFLYSIPARNETVLASIPGDAQDATTSERIPF
jgi:hypothetical protein